MSRVVEILQTVLTGLMLAFIFRAFFVEPFIIPTGSMADSLLGAHATTTCPACGCEYDVAPLRTASPTGTGFIAPDETVCPNCQLRAELPPASALPKAGDRLVVHKWPFALGVPLRRWEVIVFRDPAHPDQHYIKRLIGLPGETIEIVDGDVFVDGKVAHKPPDVQSALWLPVFDQARMPVPAAASARAARWRAVDPAGGGAAGWWGMDSRVIRYDGLDRCPRRLAFNPDSGRDYLADLNAYNRGSTGALVGDFRLVGEITLLDGDGDCTFEMTRDRRCFQAVLPRDGQVVVRSIDEDSGDTTTLAAASLGPQRVGWPIAVEFAHLDGHVYLQVDGRRLAPVPDPEFAAGPGPLRSIRRQRPVGFVVQASALRIELRGLRIDRDVYYTQSPATRRAYAGHLFELGRDEYFVLGDNSPDSHDGREWTEGASFLPASYRPGTVTGRMIVGQAAFVYLPSLLPLDAAGRWSVPDVGRARFVR